LDRPIKQGGPVCVWRRARACESLLSCIAIVSFLDSPHPLVFAHRGGCALGPENTIAAFDLGLAAGADGLELDVRFSADGVVVVCHDPTLDRTTDHAGPVAAHTAAELAGVDAGCRFVDGSGRRPFAGLGIGIPALAEVLGRYPAARIIIEMKIDQPDLGRAVVDLVRAAGAVDRVCVTSFGGRSSRAARAALPGMACGASRLEARLAVYRSMIGWPVRRESYGVFQVPERAEGLTIVSPRFIRHAHAAGLKVQVWTVNGEADMDRLFGWGVDALITDVPGLAVRRRDAFVRRA
jgi:glycerophosphoryl diester phosphodiesterase